MISGSHSYPQYVERWSWKSTTPGGYSRKLSINPDPALDKKSNRNQKSLVIPRIVLCIFHPAFMVLAFMVVLITLRVCQIASAFGSSQPQTPKQKTLGFVERSGTYTATDTLPNSKLHKRLKRSSDEDKKEEEEEHDGIEPSNENSESEPQDQDDDMSEMDEFKQPSDRRAAESSLDDMLLDAETPIPGPLCLKDEQAQEMEGRQKEEFARLQEAGRELSEHFEDCETTDDCLQISPFVWIREGSLERNCRKRTFLRCESESKMCVCEDKFDLRWDTEVDQSTYQWNPITKTCYVRSSNPCKLDIPCAPGTVCRSTVSISYNTPPIQRNCECENIEHLIYAGSQDWWYCGLYSQRAWFFDLDNIKKWTHKPFHLYERMRHSNDLNFTAKPATAPEKS